MASTIGHYLYSKDSAFPSPKTVATDSGMDRADVKRALRQLRRLGALKTAERWAPDGRQMSNTLAPVWGWSEGGREGPATSLPRVPAPSGREGPAPSGEGGARHPPEDKTEDNLKKKRKQEGRSVPVPLKTPEKKQPTKRPQGPPLDTKDSRQWTGHDLVERAPKACGSCGSPMRDTPRWNPGDAEEGPTWWLGCTGYPSCKKTWDPRKEGRAKAAVLNADAAQEKKAAAASRRSGSTGTMASDLGALLPNPEKTKDDRDREERDRLNRWVDATTKKAHRHRVSGDPAGASLLETQIAGVLRTGVLPLVAS